MAKSGEKLSGQALSRVASQAGRIRSFTSLVCSAYRIAFCMLVMTPLPLHAADASATGSGCPQRGLEIPAKVPYKSAGDIPGWRRMDSSSLDREPSATKVDYVQDILARKDNVCLVLFSIRPDRSQTVLDSVDVTRYYREGGGKVRIDSSLIQRSEGFVLRTDGSLDPEGKKDIALLVLPEKGRGDCDHFTRRVQRAWRIDDQAGRYVSMPAKRLVGEYRGGGDYCYSCKLPKPGQPCFR